MKYVVAALLLVALTANADNSTCVKNQYGEVVCGKGECVADQYKKIFCGPQGGSAVKDRYGTVVCGVGQCVTSHFDQVWCSKEPGGGAVLDSLKEAQCLGGCERATAAYCEEAK